MYVFLRIMVGIIFMVSGAEKLLGPAANFQYVIEAYQILPSTLAAVVSYVFPWIECLTGVFLVLGLWLRPAMVMAVLMSFVFIVVVSQALLRQLPLDNCGCFGDLIHFKPREIIILDAGILLGMLAALFRHSETSRFSLDFWYSRRA